MASGVSEWEPIGQQDLAAVGVATCVNVGVILILLHVVANHKWPPYRASIPTLLLCTAFTGILATLAVGMRYGLWGEQMGEVSQPVGCGAKACLLWAGAGGLFSCACVRVYRAHSILILHNGAMWPVPLQLLTVLVPLLLLPLATFFARPSLLYFDPVSQECEPRSSVPEAFALTVMVLMSAATAVLTYRLGRARLQAPDEFTAAIATSVVLVVAVVALPSIHRGLEEDLMGRRCAMVVAAALMTLAVMVPPLLRPLADYFFTDEAFDDINDLGCGKTRHQEQFYSMIQERMRADELLIAVAPSPEEKEVPPTSAMAWFFMETIDRESLRDYFLLQAATTRILDRYVRVDAPMFIPLSSWCQRSILMSRATSAFMFGRAREEVMESMAGERIGRAVTSDDKDENGGEIVEPAEDDRGSHCRSPTDTADSSGSSAGGSNQVAVGDIRSISGSISIVPRSSNTSSSNNNSSSSSSADDASSSQNDKNNSTSSGTNNSNGSGSSSNESGDDSDKNHYKASNSINSNKNGTNNNDASISDNSDNDDDIRARNKKYNRRDSSSSSSESSDSNSDGNRNRNSSGGSTNTTNSNSISSSKEYTIRCYQPSQDKKEDIIPEASLVLPTPTCPPLHDKPSPQAPHRPFTSFSSDRDVGIYLHKPKPSVGGLGAPVQGVGGKGRGHKPKPSMGGRAALVQDVGGGGEGKGGGGLGLEKVGGQRGGGATATLKRRKIYSGSGEKTPFSTTVAAVVEVLAVVVVAAVVVVVWGVAVVVVMVVAVMVVVVVAMAVFFGAVAVTVLSARCSVRANQSVLRTGVHRSPNHHRKAALLQHVSLAIAVAAAVEAAAVGRGGAAGRVAASAALAVFPASPVPLPALPSAAVAAAEAVAVAATAEYPSRTGRRTISSSQRRLLRLWRQWRSRLGRGGRAAGVLRAMRT
eukprot:jgi/Undpi1/8687/HiC_scaffold_25.g11152.m1